MIQAVLERKARGNDAFRRVVLLEPLIQAVLERKARGNDAFRRVVLLEPLIQAVLERKARGNDAFIWEDCECRLICQAVWQ